MKLIITRKNFTYTAEQIDKIGEICDIIEGTLTDNFLISTPDGYIILLEYALNTWTSAHKYIEGDQNTILQLWDELTEELRTA